VKVVKRMLMLANSIKHAPGRCIAGRELIPQSNGPSRLGPWIRPISTDGNEGTLNPHHCSVNEGGSVRVLVVYDVPLLAHADDSTQPENWIVDSSTVWTKVGSFPRARLREAWESPQGLWDEPDTKTDRISTAHLRNHLPGQSICVVPLNDAVVHADPYKQGRHRLQFDYQGIRYDLGITDPLLPQDATGNQLALAACISLTPPFRGDHYKLVATMFWPDV
jgi:hypothetical protein